MNNEYTLFDLLRRDDTRQFVVPELQRDYVWEQENWQPLLGQLLESYHVYSTPAAVPAGLDGPMLESFLTYYRQQHQGYNLGFLYAYHDPTYSSHCFLIDGQQRLTTLLLLLLAAAVQGGRIDHFTRHYLTTDGQPCLAYRVREAAQEFMVNFVRHLLAGRSPDCLVPEAHDRPYWFFSHYRYDVTISHLLSNYRGIAKWLSDKFPDAATGSVAETASFYEYLHAAVRFWYFDTSQSAQGEELYLSLNASAEPLTGSENLKARLLADLPANEKNQWGEEFEEWEQFFWEHRDRSSQPMHDASQGLDEFFRWTAICETLARVAVEAKSPNRADKLLRAGSSHLIREAIFNADQSTEAPDEAARRRLEGIDRYLRALRYLYTGWLPQAQELVMNSWGLSAAAAAAPLPRKEWLSPSVPLQPAECMRLLPMLVYLVGRGEAEWDADLQGQELFRVARYFHNLARVENVKKSPFDFTIAAIRTAHMLAAASADVADLPMLPALSFTLDQEVAKLNLFTRSISMPHSREQAEALCWALEDMPFNQGEIRHLCVDLASLTYTELEVIAHKYRMLFNGTADTRQLQTILLTYGSYQQQSSNNSYYVNYQFDNWSNTIRRPEFKQFFSELPASTDSLADMYVRRRNLFLTDLTPENITDMKQLNQQLFMLAVLYDEMLQPSDTKAGCAIWGSGNYAGWYYEGESPAEMLFNDGRDLLNAGGGFGYYSSHTISLINELSRHLTDKKLRLDELISRTLRLPAAMLVQTGVNETLYNN